MNTPLHNMISGLSNLSSNSRASRFHPQQAQPQLKQRCQPFEVTMFPDPSAASEQSDSNFYSVPQAFAPPSIPVHCSPLEASSIDWAGAGFTSISQPEAPQMRPDQESNWRAQSRAQYQHAPLSREVPSVQDRDWRTHARAQQHAPVVPDLTSQQVCLLGDATQPAPATEHEVRVEPHSDVSLSRGWQATNLAPPSFDLPARSMSSEGRGRAGAPSGGRGRGRGTVAARGRGAHGAAESGVTVPRGELSQTVCVQPSQPLSQINEQPISARITERMQALADTSASAQRGQSAAGMSDVNSRIDALRTKLLIK